MRIEGTFLKSKVAKRIFLLFLLSALIPMCILATVGYLQIETYLDQQSQTDLSSTTSRVFRSLVERVHLSRSQLKILANTLESVDGVTFRIRPEWASDEIPFKSIAYVNKEGRVYSLFGNIGFPGLEEAEALHFEKNGACLKTVETGPETAALLLFVKPDRNELSDGIIFAELDFKYLLTIDEEGSFSIKQKIAVVDENWRFLYSSFAPGSLENDYLRETLPSSSNIVRAVSLADDSYYLTNRSVPLKFTYGLDHLKVILGQSISLSGGPLRRFRTTFPYILIISILLVSIMSISQIRRYLVPIERLQEGTQRIAQADFTTTVTVQSGDEFQQLAESFNRMASQLGAQFETLSAIDELDRAILSALRSEQVIQVLMTQVPQFLKTSAISLVILGDSESTGSTKYERSRGDGLSVQRSSVRVNGEILSVLSQHPDGLLIDGDRVSAFSSVTPGSLASSFVLPIHFQQRLAAVMAAQWTGSALDSSVRFQQFRQLGEQVAVALTNASLIEELDEFAWSTITALARTVDAKSPWTSGHSERVADLSIEIAKNMQLDGHFLEQIKKGGLLHDIGKIGISVEILDKPGILTKQEFTEMKRHPEIGAHILSPLKAFSNVVSIVRNHHERFDGRGYPDGLTGEKIPLPVRIVTVADVFDALRSDRPYRSQKPTSEVLSMIAGGSGTQFDPLVVQTLLSMANEGSGYLELVYSGELPNLRKADGTPHSTEA